ncbi:MAG: hypothetical protein Kow009_05860 [Spirochaetales bacterium]
MATSLTNLRTIEIGGKFYLGIRVASGKGVQSFIRLVNKEDRKGLILSDTGLDEWDIQGFTELDGELYLYGPSFQSLPEPFIHLFDLPPGTSLPSRWILFIRRLSQLSRTTHLPDKLYPQGMFFLEDGRLLILPEKIMDRVLSLEPLDQRITYFESCNHPDLTGEPNCSFFLAALTYRFCTGKDPYGGSTEEEIHSEMRTLPPVPASLERPGLNEELSEFLQTALTAKEKPSLYEWKERIESLSRQPLLSQLTEEETARKRKEAKRFLAERIRTQKRRNFWMKYKTHVLGLLLISLIGGYFLYDILSNALRPPRTLGMSPEEVVHLFYSSMNTLDHQAMEDCVDGKAGKSYIDEVTRLYVVSRMRMSVEMKNPMIDAETWYRKGRPAIPEGQTLYGIASLSIQQEGQDPEKGEDGSKQYRVQFDRWVPLPASMEGRGRFKGFRVEERVTLEKEGKRWVIVEIQPQRSDPLPPPPSEGSPEESISSLPPSPVSRRP